MARDPKRLLTIVRQIALVKITFIVKRATIRVETIFMRYVNPKLLQLVKHSFFCCYKHRQNRCVSLEHHKYVHGGENCVRSKTHYSAGTRTVDSI